MTPSTTPLVTVGVPIYNGEPYIADAIESILAQTLGDFELLISDNASTDATVAICERYAAADRRVRVIRHRENIGLPRNWNSLVPEARGEFFKWCSASDHCMPTLLERCVAALRADPSLVLCYGGTGFTDINGHIIGTYDGDFEVVQPSASERYWSACQSLRLNNPMFGVIRTAVLRKTRLDRLYPSGDTVLTAEIALHGGIRALPEVLLLRRQTSETFSSMRTALSIQRMYDPNATRPLRFLHLRRLLDHFATITRAPVILAERLRAYGFALRMLLWARAALWNELRSAMAPDGR